MNKYVYTSALSALLLAGVAVAQNNENMRVEVIHHFTAETERDAIRVFADELDARGGTWVDNAVAGQPNTRRVYTSSMQAGQPSQAYTTVTNRDHVDLLNRYLVDIEDVALAENWRDNLPEVIVDSISGEDGKIYLAPAALYVPNMVFYNKKVFDELGIEPPTTYDDKFFAALETLKQNGILPLAFSADAFNIRFPFEGMLLALGGPEMWHKIWVENDEETLRSDAFRDILENFGRLREYADDGAINRAWNLSANLLSSGEAGMQIMGSWADGEYRAAGLQAGEDFGCFIPGNMVQVHADVFAFPKQPRSNTATEGQKLLASVVMDSEVQRRHIEPRGGAMPVRTDAELPENGGACLELAVETYRTEGALAPSPRSHIDPQADGEYRDLINEYYVAPEMTTDEVVDRFIEILQMYSY